MRFALVLAVLTSVFVSTGVATARPRKHHSTRAAAKVKTSAKTSKRSHTAKTHAADVAVAATDDAVDADSAEAPPMPKVQTSAPMSGSPVAQASDDEEPPAKKKR